MISKRTKKTLLTAGIILVCVFSFAYWLYSRFYVATDNAYVNANVVQIAARVTGKIQHLPVQNNQLVKQDQLLFELDPSTFQVAIDEASAQVNVHAANLKLAEVTADRTTQLVKKNVASAQENDINQSALKSAMANLALSKASQMQAELNFSYSKVYAPTSGWVTNITLREGDIITANQPLFALVSNNEFWVDANFKETEIAALHPGQTATIEVDMYPGHPFTGVIDSISSGTGAAFSLLPPENATGNWVKVTQRVPVKIRITDPDINYPLRIGTTASVSVRVNPWSNK